MLINATEKEMRFIEMELLHHMQSGGILEVEVIPDDEDTSESPGYEATTLLHLAAKYGNIKATKFLIDSGYNVDVTNSFGCTPLMIAIHFDEPEVVTTLLNANADIFLCNPGGLCAAKLALLKPKKLAAPIFERLKLTCCNDSRETAKKLLEIDCPLARATLLKDTTIVNYMLDSGRIVDEIDCHFSKCTALHYAVCLEDLNMINLLLDRGIDVNVLAGDGLTPLFDYDTQSEDTSEKLKILKTLLNRGASLSWPEAPTDTTPVKYLLTEGQRDTVRILLEHVDDLSSKNKKGVPLFHLLMLNHNPGIIELWKNSDQDFNVLDDAGRTALFIAAVHGLPEAVEVLIKKGVDVNAATPRGTTAIICLASNPSDRRIKIKNQLSSAEVLLRHGVDAQCISGETRTILDVIIRYNNWALAKIILAHLALIEELGQPIKELIIYKIDAEVKFKKYFGFCKGWLAQMKKTVIWGQLTLFKLLTENEENMRIHARNPKLVAQLERIMVTQRRSTMYYCNILRRRVKTVMRYAELKNQIRLLVSENYDLCNNDYLIEKIVEFIH